MTRITTLLSAQILYSCGEFHLAEKLSPPYVSISSPELWWSNNNIVRNIALNSVCGGYNTWQRCEIQLLLIIKIPLQYNCAASRVV